MKKVALVMAFGLALAAGVGAQAPVDLKVGDTAPAFSLPGTDGKTHTLADYKGRFVVLAWYPKAFTGGCTAECKAFTSSGETIKSFNVAYFMASVDDADTNKKFAEQEQANFPMLSDPSKKVADAYGVLTPTPGVGFAKRWTFYIGPDGKILYIDKAVNTATAGADLAARLESLGARKK
ncbi:MAG: peroxiredoxin family protein [Acidobacteria bacterium]|nr:MAG: peroxiredoxin family protein [Acidobacteriota bacterium]